MAPVDPKKIVFALAPRQNGAPLLLMGIPAAAWDYMKDGKTHTFDLQAIGIPVQLMLYGSSTHEEALKIIEDHCKESGTPLLDERRRDFSIRAFETRKANNAKIKRKDNSRLPAGSMMYYYCRACGEEMVRSETHSGPAPRYCGACISEHRDQKP